jgi:hypothetical protein
MRLGGAHLAPIRWQAAFSPLVEIESDKVTKYLDVVRLIITNVIVPGIFVFTSAWQNYDSRLQWLLWFLGMTAYMIYTYVTGLWFLFGYYLRFVLLALFCFACVKSFVSTIGRPFLLTTSLKDGIGIFFFALFSSLSAAALKGYQCVDGGIESSFPLRDGLYYVAHGGNSVLINHHKPAGYAAFAVDIVKLNRIGFRACGFYPKALTQYFIFGEIVYSPVEGTVVKSVDGLPDMVPPDQDRRNPAGNYVVIKHPTTGTFIFLVHLQRNSVLVSEGEAVHGGQPIGRIGNSGVSTEPHLHIHCEIDDVGEYNHSGEGVPLLFDGRFLRRNSLVRC